MAERVPVVRISLINATILSGVFFLFAVVVELIRRVFGSPWAERLSRTVEAFPAKMLDTVGLLDPLVEAWQSERISGTTVRVMYGLVVVALIFAMGLVVGGLMGLIARPRKGSGEEFRDHQ